MDPDNVIPEQNPQDTKPTETKPDEGFKFSVTQNDLDRPVDIPTPAPVVSEIRQQAVIGEQEKPWFTDGFDIVKGVGRGLEEIVGDVYDLADFVVGDGLKDWDRSNPWVTVDSKAGELVSGLVRYGLEALPVGAGLKGLGLVAKGYSTLGKAGAFIANSAASNFGASLIFQRDGDRVLPALGLDFELLKKDETDNEFMNRLKLAIDQGVTGIFGDAAILGLGKAGKAVIGSTRQLLGSAATEATTGIALKERARLTALREGYSPEEALDIASKVGNDHLKRAKKLEIEARRTESLPIHTIAGKFDQSDPMFNSRATVVNEIAAKDAAEGLIREMGFSPVDRAGTNLEGLVNKKIFNDDMDLVDPTTAGDYFRNISKIFEGPDNLPENINLDSFVGLDSVKLGVKALGYEVNKAMTIAFKKISHDDKLVGEFMEEVISDLGKSLGVNEKSAAKLFTSIREMTSVNEIPTEILASNLYAYSLISKGLSRKIGRKLRVLNLDTASDLELSKAIREIEEAVVVRNSIFNGINPDTKAAKLREDISGVLISQPLPDNIAIKEKELLALIQASEDELMTKTIFGKSILPEGLDPKSQEYLNAQLEIDKSKELRAEVENRIKGLEKNLENLRGGSEQGLKVNRRSEAALQDIAAKYGIEADAADTIPVREIIVDSDTDRQITRTVNITRKQANLRRQAEDLRAKVAEVESNPRLTPEDKDTEKKFLVRQIVEVNRLEEQAVYASKELSLVKLYERILDEMDSSIVRNGKADPRLVQARKEISDYITKLKTEKGKVKADAEFASKMERKEYEMSDKEKAEFLDIFTKALKDKGETDDSIVNIINAINADIAKAKDMADDALELILGRERSLYAGVDDLIDRYDPTIPKKLPKNTPDLVAEYGRNGVDRETLVSRLSALQGLVTDEVLNQDQIPNVLFNAVEGAGYFRRVVNRLSAIQTNNILGNFGTLARIVTNNLFANTLDAINESVGGVFTLGVGGGKALQYEMGKFFGFLHSIKDINVRRAFKSIWRGNEARSLTDNGVRGYLPSATSDINTTIAQQKGGAIDRTFTKIGSGLEAVSSLGGGVGKAIASSDEVVKQIGYRSAMYANIFAEYLSKDMPRDEARRLTEIAYDQLLNQVEAVSYKTLLKEGRERAATAFRNQGIVGTQDAIEVEAQKYVARSLDIVGEQKLLEMSSEALSSARINTASQDMAKWGNKLQEAAYSYPIIKLTLPFIRGPLNALYNSFDYMMSPIRGAEVALVNGWAKLNKDVGSLPYAWKNKLIASNNRTVKELMSGNPVLRARAIGRTVTAASLYTVTYFAATNAYTGKPGIFIVGTGPNDPQRQKALRDRGILPKSIGHRKEDGSVTSFSYEAFEPVALLLTTMADFASHAVLSTDDDKDGMAAAIFKSMEGTADKALIQSLGEAVQIGLGKEKAIGDFLSNLLSNLAPASGLGSSAQSLYLVDEQERRGENMPMDDIGMDMETLKDIGRTLVSKYPWLSSEVGAKGKKYNAFGEPMEGLGTRSDTEFMKWLRYIHPVKGVKEVSDPVTEEIIKTNASMGIPKKLNRNNKKVNLLDSKFDMDGVSAYDKFNELLSGTQLGGNSRTVRGAISDLIGKKQYTELSNGTENEDNTQKIARNAKQRDMIQQVYGDYREAAWNKLVNQNPALKQYLIGN